MGNAISPCIGFRPWSSRKPKLVSVVFWEGSSISITTTRRRRRRGGKVMIAGEIMVENPDKVVCHADSFYIGHPIPTLSIQDELLAGETYLVLPIDLFPCKLLTASSLASLASTRSPRVINFGECNPFHYLKGSNGRVLIKVAPDFMVKLLITTPTAGRVVEEDEEEDGFLICTTPELRKHYHQLVGSREHTWSPKLDTISEYKLRYSPCRFIGLEWKQKEDIS